MSVNETICLEDAIVGAETLPSRKELRQRRQRSHAGGDAESAMVEKHLPLVRTIVGRIAVSLPSHVLVDDQSVYGAAEVCPRVNPECCFCQEPIEGEAFAEISVRQPGGAFRSVLYGHLACLGSRVHPLAAHIVTAAG